MMLYDFYAPWCVPCKKIFPTVAKVTTEKNIPLKKINVEDSRHLFDKFNVKTVPTLILVDEQEGEIKRVINPRNEKEINIIFEG